MIETMLENCDSVEIGALRNVGAEGEKLVSQAYKKNDSESILKWLSYENANNQANILIRPCPSNPHPWLFFDDLPFSVANSLSEKYQCAILETSFKNYQARLLSNCNLSAIDRYNAQRQIVKLLHGNADLGSVAGDKFGRLPGFKNRKKGKNFWTFLAAIPDKTLPKFDPQPYLSPSPPYRGGCVSMVNKNQTKTNTEYDQSAIDFGFVFNRLRYFKKAGFDYLAESKKLEFKLIESSKLRKSNPEDYAKRTIKKAMELI